MTATIPSPHSDGPNSPGAAAEGRAARFRFVDALRGIAAVAVAAHHFLHKSALEPTLREPLGFCHYGLYGVQVFFVLSGFVIAHSLRRGLARDGSSLNFLARRQLRLDPPYWIVLLFTVLVSHLEPKLLPWIERKPLAGVSDTILNALYLQNITSAISVVDVAWTLCLEIQFYLVFVLLILTAQAVGKDRLWKPLAGGSVLALGLASLLLPPYSADAWFIQWWYYFAAGVLCYASLKSAMANVPFLVLIVAVAYFAAERQSAAMMVGAGTALLLCAAGKFRFLEHGLNWPLLQYFGRISYSLYLVHFMVGTYVLRIGYRLTGDKVVPAIGWFLLAFLASVGAAHLFYRYVEQPSMQFAKRCRWFTQSRVPGVAVAA